MEMLAARTHRLCLRAALGDVFEFARAAAGHHGHANGFAVRPRDDEVEAGFCAVASIEFNTISPAPSDTARSAHSTASRRWICGRRARRLPICPCDALGVNRNDDALAAKFFRAFAMSSGRASALELMLILSAPARSIVKCRPRTDAAADSERHEAWSAARSITSTIVPRRARGR